MKKLKFPNQMPLLLLFRSNPPTEGGGVNTLTIPPNEGEGRENTLSLLSHAARRQLVPFEFKFELLCLLPATGVFDGEEGPNLEP